jgi:hypothetical protein
VIWYAIILPAALAAEFQLPRGNVSD